MGSCISKPVKHKTMGEQLDLIQEQLQKQYQDQINIQAGYRLPLVRSDCPEGIGFPEGFAPQIFANYIPLDRPVPQGSASYIDFLRKNHRLVE